MGQRYGLARRRRERQQRRLHAVFIGDSKQSLNDRNKVQGHILSFVHTGHAPHEERAGQARRIRRGRNFTKER